MTSYRPLRVAELIQADWEKVGIKAKLITFEWAEYRKRAKGGEHQVIMFGWSGSGPTMKFRSGALV